MAQNQRFSPSGAPVVVAAGETTVSLTVTIPTFNVASGGNTQVQKELPGSLLTDRVIDFQPEPGDLPDPNIIGTFTLFDNSNPSPDIIGQVFNTDGGANSVPESNWTATLVRIV